MSTQAPERSYRIGDVAERVGVTTRTIRYYEELGLLGTASARTKGAHRLYTEADIARLEELIRLRDLLGLTLEELVALAEAEEARAALRNQWAESATDSERARIVEGRSSMGLGIRLTRSHEPPSISGSTAPLHTRAFYTPPKLAWVYAEAYA